MGAAMPFEPDGPNHEFQQNVTVPEPRSSSEAREPTHWGIEFVAGALIIVTAALFAARLPSSASEARCLVVAFAVMAVAGCSRDLLTLLFLVPTAGALVSGFLVGGPDTLVWCLAALTVAALAGRAAGRFLRASSAS
ncbi:hypothetical protein [Kineosporia babensis]|uniref:Uncharacterized protein n=1 Tax=Kineosporia babensis TaxID=499548 RepID=A0A9X1NDI6_9ACTN|nr:hypothetical protein [Kineosporia babensis]MCD5311849.1 hypothetical protein [Kineosporia babensis]